MKQTKDKSLNEIIEDLKEIEVCGTKYQMFYNELIQRIEEELKKRPNYIEPRVNKYIKKYLKEREENE